MPMSSNKLNYIKKKTVNISKKRDGLNAMIVVVSFGLILVISLFVPNLSNPMFVLIAGIAFVFYLFVKLLNISSDYTSSGAADLPSERDEADCNQLARDFDQALDRARELDSAFEQKRLSQLLLVVVIILMVGATIFWTILALGASGTDAGVMGGWAFLVGAAAAAFFLEYLVGEEELRELRRERGEAFREVNRIQELMDEMGC